MEMMPSLSADSAKTLIADTLRLYVGHGRRIGWADLASATGDSERKLRAYVEADGSMMPIDVALRLFAVLPPDAFARVARAIGFGIAPLDCDDAATLRRAVSQCSRLVADASEALEDGVLSPREKAQLSEAAGSCAVTLQSLAGLKMAGSGSPH
jgi:hypothetical protein